MEFNKKLMISLAAAFVAAAGVSEPTFALEAKQCLPMAEMNAALKADGQRTMIIGDRLALQNPTGKFKDVDVKRFVNTVTSNADGSTGYQLEGNLPRAQASESVCVRAKLTNVRLLDARKAGVAKEALLGGKFDEAVRIYEQDGTRPMVVADTVIATADGAGRLGLPMVLFGNMEKQAALMYTRLANGQPQEMMLLGSTEYTPAALQRLSGVTQVAMRVPN